MKAWIWKCSHITGVHILFLGFLFLISAQTLSGVAAPWKSNKGPFPFIVAGLQKSLSFQRSAEIKMFTLLDILTPTLKGGGTELKGMSSTQVVTHPSLKEHTSLSLSLSPSGWIKKNDRTVTLAHDQVENLCSGLHPDIP